MTRVKKGVNALKWRRNLLSQTKGYRFGRSKKERQATEAMFHAGTYAFAHRKDKKGEFRRVNIVKMNALLDELGVSYSKFIPMLKSKEIALDRKILAQLAEYEPETFKALVAAVK
jgi:large subunit ribosomal protein L20